MPAVLGLVLAAGLLGCQRDDSGTVPPASNHAIQPRTESFIGSRPGEERKVAGITLCWCPSGTFTMGSPAGESDAGPTKNKLR